MINIIKIEMHTFSKDLTVMEQHLTGEECIWIYICDLGSVTLVVVVGCADSGFGDVCMFSRLTSL